MTASHLSPTQNYLRTALFVDFDNVFLQLQSEDETVAALFAEQPDRWLRWLAQYSADQYLNGTAGQQRRILLRRAYLNPRAFHRYRAPFIRFGFEVVDCPPLTNGGKTSTDIYMVMDIMDAIVHSTRFDEFIIMSSDADFTPIIARLRKHDRFTLVISLGQAAAAYRAACDHLVEQDEFIEYGIGVKGEGSVSGIAPPREIASAERDLLVGIAAAVAQVVDGTGPVPANQLPAIYKQFPEFTAGESWLGFGSLRGLTNAVVAMDSSLVVDEGKDPWEVRLTERVAASQAAPTSGATIPSMEEVGRYVQTLVEESEAPIDLARLSQLVTREFSDSVRSDDWQGTGSFKGYLSELPLGSLAISSITPGFAYDPERHQPPAGALRRGEDEFEKQYPDIAELARKIHYVTDMPYLTPEVYGVVLKEIAKELNDRGYHPVETSKRVRDSCNGKGIPVARAHVTFVLRGLIKAGHRFREEGMESADQLGEILVESTFRLCEWAELGLSDEERRLVDAWIRGGLTAGSS